MENVMDALRGIKLVRMAAYGFKNRVLGVPPVEFFTWALGVNIL